MRNIDFRKVIMDSLIEHDFTIKATVIAGLNLLLPLIWPVLGVTFLMIVDIWSGYQSNKRKGLPFMSKGLGRTLNKWINFLIGILVVVVVDSIFIAYAFLPGMVFTSVFITITALRELKSISENFSGLGLAKVIKVVSKYVTSKKTDLYQIIDEEVEEVKENNDVDKKIK